MPPLLASQPPSRVTGRDAGCWPISGRPPFQSLPGIAARIPFLLEGCVRAFVSPPRRVPRPPRAETRVACRPACRAGGFPVFGYCTGGWDIGRHRSRPASILQPLPGMRPETLRITREAPRFLTPVVAGTSRNRVPVFTRVPSRPRGRSRQPREVGGGGTPTRAGVFPAAVEPRPAHLQASCVIGRRDRRPSRFI